MLNIMPITTAIMPQFIYNYIIFNDYISIAWGRGNNTDRIVVQFIADELEVLQTCVRMPAAELLQPAAIELCYYG